jgi:hypothetical protein
MLLAALAAAGVASAHPFDATFHGHQLEVALDGETLRVAYLVEVPTVAALADLERFLEGVDAPGPEHQAAYTRRVLDELETGLRVEVDGQAVALDRVEPDEPSGVGDRRFITFRVLLEGGLPEDATTLHVVNANFPGEKALFANQAWVDDGVLVYDTDLVRLDEGRVVADEGGRWLAGEENREIRLSFLRADPAQGWLRARQRAWVEPEAGPLRVARAALVVDPPGLVRRTLTSGEVGGGAMAAALAGAAQAGLPAALLGAGLAALGGGPAALLFGLVVGAALTGVAGLLGAPAVGVGAACLALAVAAAVAAGRRPRAGAALAAAALACIPGATALACAGEAASLGADPGALLAAAAWGPAAVVAALGWGAGRAGLRAHPGLGRRVVLLGGILSALGAWYWIP